MYTNRDYKKAKKKLEEYQKIKEVNYLWDQPYLNQEAGEVKKEIINLIKSERLKERIFETEWHFKDIDYIHIIWSAEIPLVKKIKYLSLFKLHCEENYNIENCDTIIKYLKKELQLAEKKRKDVFYICDVNSSFDSGTFVTETWDEMYSRLLNAKKKIDAYNEKNKEEYKQTIMLNNEIKIISKKYNDKGEYFDDAEILSVSLDPNLEIMSCSRTPNGDFKIKINADKEMDLSVFDSNYSPVFPRFFKKNDIVRFETSAGEIVYSIIRMDQRSSFERYQEAVAYIVNFYPSEVIDRGELYKLNYSSSNYFYYDIENLYHTHISFYNLEFVDYEDLPANAKVNYVKLINFYDELENSEIARYGVVENKK